MYDTSTPQTRLIFEGKTFFDLFIYVVTQFMMPLGGIFVTIFAGWAIKQQFSRDELFNGESPLAYKAWLFLVRFVAPPLLAFVLWDVMTS